jgi:AraC-like DNA-binding protein
VSGRDLTIGVRLRPGALPHFIRDSASQLTDRSESLESIIGSSARRVTERIAEAAPADRVPLLTEFLSHHLGQDHIPPITKFSVVDLERGWGLSRRTVYDRMINAIGLGPKAACRIQRLHIALANLHSGARLADVALGAGYADQPHLTREAVRLLGESPGYWRRRGCSIVQDTQDSARP